MALWKPDPTFYASPRDAVSAPAEKLAYVAAFDRAAEKPDAIAVLDVDPGSGSYGSVVGWTELPYLGDELHHFGWNACVLTHQYGHRLHFWDLDRGVHRQSATLGPSIKWF